MYLILRKYPCHVMILGHHHHHHPVFSVKEWSDKLESLKFQCKKNFKSILQKEKNAFRHRARQG